MKVALGAILRNDFPYLLEWVAYHRSIGIDHFYFANLQSDDGTNELVSALEKAGIATSFYVPWNEWIPQESLIKQIVDNYSNRADWMAILDIDEFIVPEKDVNLKNYLKSVPENIGGIIINWALYGSGLTKIPDDAVVPGFVTKRFYRRADKDELTNLHYKTIFRTKNYSGEDFINPHCAPLDKASKTANTLLQTTKNYGKSDTVIWDKIRINHYSVKTPWEYYNIKIRKGIHSKFERNWSFFLGHDTNYVQEFFPEKLHQNLKTEFINLKNKIESFGFKYPIKNNPITPVADYRIENIINMYNAFRVVNTGGKNNPITPPADFRIEKVTVNIDNTIWITGWSIDNYGYLNVYNRNFSAKNKHSHAKLRQIIAKPRLDILSQIPYAERHCGFEIIFSPLPKSDTENFTICEDDIPFLEVNPIEKTCKFL